MKPAVVIIDMLDDSVTGALANPRARRVVPRIAELAAATRERSWPVVWGPHALAGTPGAWRWSPRPPDRRARETGRPWAG